MGFSDIARVPVNLTNNVSHNHIADVEGTAEVVEDRQTVRDDTDLTVALKVGGIVVQTIGNEFKRIADGQGFTKFNGTSWGERLGVAKDIVVIGVVWVPFNGVENVPEFLAKGRCVHTTNVVVRGAVAPLDVESRGKDQIAKTTTATFDRAISKNKKLRAGVPRS